MILRALLAFVALPGVVAFTVPIAIGLYNGAQVQLSVVGVVVFSVGLSGLLWCVHSFFVNGQGTLAPWSPPKRLVVVGLYRCSRNPMYVSVIILLVGWSVLFHSVELVIYAGLIALGFRIRVVVGEEPWLARHHGLEWVQYVERVPRWFGLPAKSKKSNTDH